MDGKTVRLRACCNAFNEFKAVGVDSMIAEEFRTWFWSASRVDVPFLDLMSAQTSIVGLVEGKLGGLEDS